MERLVINQMSCIREDLVVPESQHFLCKDEKVKVRSNISVQKGAIYLFYNAKGGGVRVFFFFLQSVTRSVTSHFQGTTRLLECRLDT